MIILDGKNLGERQRQLNNKVNDAAKGKVDFNVVKEQDEKSDVDKLFKIDLAAKYKNVEYILEIFKCGDHLYISRALDKCTWLYDDEFKHIVNKDYLSENIFPFMSIKMRNKMLTTIATYLKNHGTRAAEFCAYSMKRKLYNIALKFLIHTPKSFKRDVIAKKTKMFELVTQKEGDYLEHFIGDSFDLAENYVNNFDYPGQKRNKIYLLKYMYSLSNEKYLDMLETCDFDDHAHVLGRRLSKHIIQNHKSRVMNKPFLYANVLNKDIIKRNCKVEEAKIFAVALLPDRSTSFFTSRFSHSNYYDANKFVMDLIPAQEKFTFIKKIFSEKYKDAPFETSYEFYSNNFFEIMTIIERESWALQNLASQNEILGSDNDYLWYKFVNFEKAFNQLRKEIMKTTDHTKRSEILKVLLDSAKNEEELTKLLNYFCERHRNEVKYVTDTFLSKLIEDHKVWRFGENCWKALEKIFYNIEVFDKSKYRHCDGYNRVVALMYYVLNEKPVPEVLNEFLDMNAICFSTLKRFLKKSKSETDTIFQYVLRYYTKRVEEISSILCEEDTKKKNLRTHLRCALDIAQHCEKSKDDLPEIVMFHIKLDWSKFEHHKLLAGKRFSSSDIMHYLKEDATLVITEFSQIQKYCEDRGNINWLIHKLKVYFCHDISEKYLNIFNEYLRSETLHYITVEVAVRGIFILADWASKIEFLDKYTPTDKRMDKAKMCTNTLDIQRAICKQMLCSRPPLPLKKVFKYVTGDYVQYCLVLFRSFLVNLPQPQCLEFVQMMINSPISIQKHGLRLAFECFETEKLQTIILDSWNKTKNVSLRMVLYNSLSMKISVEYGEAQLTLFDVLITLTLNLNEDDDEALKIIETIKLPNHLVGRYLEAAWNTVSKFSEKPQNFARMVRIINRIESKLNEMPEDCVDKIINDHVHFMFDEGQIINNFKQGFDGLLRSKSNLILSSLTYTINEKKLEKNLKIAKHIIKKCIEMWNKLDESGSKYVLRHFLKNFITDLDAKSYGYDKNSYSNYVTLINVIEQDLKKALPEKEIYYLIWILRSSAVTKKAILRSQLSSKTLEHDDIKELGIKFGNDFGMLIKTNVEDGTFYRMFCDQITNIVTTTVDNFYSYFRNPDLFSPTESLILFCLGLLKHEIFETYMLALNMLPLEYDGKFLDAYLSAIKKIQSYQHTELQFYVYEKFVNTDFKKRNYVN